MGGCGLGVALAVPTSAGELLGWAVIAGIPAGLPLSLCSLFGYHMVAANPRLSVVVRWLSLCVLVWVFLAALAVIFIATDPRFAAQVIGPLAVVHGTWTALFLIGRKVPDGEDDST